jgi:tetratricopeptide (TPR) repeat protein
MRSTRWFSALALVAILSLAAPVSAAPVDTKGASRHYKKGLTEYNLGHFDAAVEEFEQAYALNPQPILLYNIAQSHRQLGHHERALFFYRRYLEGAPEAKNRVDIEARMRELEESLKRENDVRTQPPPAPAAPQPVIVQLQPAPAPSNHVREESLRTSAPPAPVDQGRNLRIGGLVVAGVGVAAVATGLVFGLQAKSKGESVSSAGRFDPDADSAGRRAQTLQWVFYGVGVAALAAGATTYYFGLDSGDGRVSLAPAVSPDGLGATVRGGF